MKEYQIKSFLDIIEQIPREKLDSFLTDFKSYLLSLYFLKETGQFQVSTSETEMVWIDDGKDDLTIEIEKIYHNPTSKNLSSLNIDSICLSYRHDFGLLDEKEKERLRFNCKEWIRAIEKEIEYNKGIELKIDKRFKKQEAK